jgi:hypothetical protein
MAIRVSNETKLHPGDIRSLGPLSAENHPY